MEDQIGAWSVVVVGHWNTRILRPRWLHTNSIATTDSIKIEVPLDGRGRALRYTFEDVIVNPDEEQLVVSPQVASDEVLSRTETVAKAILEHLPHTPVFAVGVNFEFSDAHPNADLIKVFTHSDDAGLVDRGYAAEQITVQRRFALDDGVLNLSLTLASDSGLVTANFNFHRDVNLPKEASTFLRIIKYRDTAHDILARVYNSPVRDSD